MADVARQYHVLQVQVSVARLCGKVCARAEEDGEEVASTLFNCEVQGCRSTPICGIDCGATFNKQQYRLVYGDTTIKYTV